MLRFKLLQPQIPSTALHFEEKKFTCTSTLFT